METLVTVYCSKSQKAIGTISWWYHITVLLEERGPSLFCELSVMILNCVASPARWFCDALWKVSDYKEGILTSPQRAN